MPLIERRLLQASRLGWWLLARHSVHDFEDRYLEILHQALSGYQLKATVTDKQGWNELTERCKGLVLSDILLAIEIEVQSDLCAQERDSVVFQYFVDYNSITCSACAHHWHL